MMRSLASVLNVFKQWPNGHLITCRTATISNHAIVAMVAYFAFILKIYCLPAITTSASQLSVMTTLAKIKRLRTILENTNLKLVICVIYLIRFACLNCL